MDLNHFFNNWILDRFRIELQKNYKIKDQLCFFLIYKFNKKFSNNSGLANSFN